MAIGSVPARTCLVGSAVALALLVTACGKKDEAAPAAPATTGPTANVAAPVPDVGKVERVKVSAQGFGRSAGEAVAEAMKLAILQVNGATIETASIGVKYGLDVTLNQDSASLRASSFTEAVRQRSGGAIQGFQIVEMREPSKPTEPFKATIEAEIAKFVAPASLQKIKVVIAPLRFEGPTLPMGDRSVAAPEVGAALGQRISDALVNTGRFAVLDREVSPEIEQELAMISSGKAPSAELAKLSQAASADLIWSGRVSSFAYNRHARALKTSDRELVSYSGGWAMSQKLVNVATRQVMASNSLSGTAPSTEPTTLGAGVDSGKVMEDMGTALVNQVVTSILRTTFPVTVVSRDGTNVVLSQGGLALREGARYAMVVMGAEMKDPQTGQSLGRIESNCCELVVERVTPNLSYGHLENVRSNLEQLPIGGLQLRDEVKVSAAKVAAIESSPAGRTESAPSVATSVRAAAVRPAVAPVAAPATDDKW